MRKFNPDPDYSTKNSDRFGERSLYIVKYDEDFAYTEAYLSPEFLREYSIGRGDETEEHWHFRPCVGGYVVDGPSGERFTERSFELTKMLFKRYVGWCKSHYATSPPAV